MRSLARCRWAVGALETAARRTQERLKEISDCIRGADLQPRFAPCSIAAVAGEVVGVLTPLAAQHGVALAARGLDGLPGIVADEGLLFTALYNLVNNAIPEVPAGGSVTIAGEADPAGGVLVSVADTGRGMSPEAVQQLFSDRRTSRKRLGSGLGARIVKNAVEAHGGSVAVESAPGAGTIFRIRLPAAPPTTRV